MEFEYQFDAPGQSHSLVIHNDARTVWAYLRDPNGIVGDAWLFNVTAPPDDPAPERGRPPLNPRRFCTLDPKPVIQHADDVGVRWEYDDAGDLVAAEVSVDGERIARLAPGARPGWSKFAAIDGPCARRLT
jgi:hypothetical protein